VPEVLKGIIGTVAELSSVDEKYRTAISVAAGGKLQAVLTEDDEAASHAIQYLKRKGLGRVTFLPMNKMLAPRARGRALMLLKNQGVEGLAIELVDFDERYRNAFAYVFGDTVVVDSIEDARRYMGGVRLVTLEGELIEKSGAMTGGVLRQQRFSFGASKGEVERLGAEIQEMQAHHDALSARLSLVREEISGLQKELDGYRGGSVEDAARLETERNRIHSRLRAQREMVKKAEAEMGEMNALIEKKTSEVEALHNELNGMEEKVKELNELLLRAADRNLTESLNRLEAEKSEIEETVRGLENKVELASQQIALIEERIAAFKNQIEENTQRIEEGKKKETELSEQLKEFRENKEALLHVQLSMSKELDDVRRERDGLRDAVKDIERDIEKERTRFSTYREMVEDAEVELRELQETFRTLKEEYALQGRTIEATDLPSEEELKKLSKVLSDRMRRLEPVNMLAIEEYDRVLEKEKTKKKERKRLEEQRDELEKVVATLTEKKKRALDEIFLEVNKNFREIFSILSGGGIAELVLENPENPFEGGLIIKAAPVGKKVSYLNALSGGEKSLTALAFIFAIQRYMPSPFYYLDEVDMFLDASNAGNVAAMIRANSKYAQIIIVSLRKVTLMNSDNLYGVTMHGKGLSDVVTFISKDSLKYIAGKDLKDDENTDGTESAPGSSNISGLTQNNEKAQDGGVA